jgi:hypothetical protein
VCASACVCGVHGLHVCLGLGLGWVCLVPLKHAPTQRRARTERSLRPPPQLPTPTLNDAGVEVRVMMNMWGGGVGLHVIIPSPCIPPPALSSSSSSPRSSTIGGGERGVVRPSNQTEEDRCRRGGGGSFVWLLSLSLSLSPSPGSLPLSCCLHEPLSVPLVFASVAVVVVMVIV